MAYTGSSLTRYSNDMFEEAPEKAPKLPEPEIAELDPQALTPAERKALGLTEKTPETEETAQ